MNIIIDGYNLLKQALAKTTINERERNQFLSLAQKYAHEKNHLLYVIFDGGPSDRPTAERREGVIVIYSGWKQTADDVIKAYVDDKIIKNVLLVTTDRYLNTYASQAQIPSIDSLDFYRFMKLKQPTSGLKKVSGPAIKLGEDSPGGESCPELDQLMQEGASMLYYKEEDRVERPSRDKGSKTERRLSELIKKL